MTKAQQYFEQLVKAANTGVIEIEDGGNKYRCDVVNSDKWLNDPDNEVLYLNWVTEDYDLFYGTSLTEENFETVEILEDGAMKLKDYEDEDVILRQYLPSPFEKI